MKIDDGLTLENCQILETEIFDEFFEIVFLFLFWFEPISWVIKIWSGCDASSPRDRKFIYHLDSLNLLTKTADCNSAKNNKNKIVKL